LRFPDHLALCRGGRITNYAEHLPPLLKVLDVDPCVVAREDVEKAVAWINGQPRKEWTKRDYKAGAQKVHPVREAWQPQQGDADSRRRWLDKLKG